MRAVVAWRCFVMIPLLGVLQHGAARGTTGGPELAELLGWDARESKAFFRIVYVGESGDPDAIFYLNLGGPTPRQLVRVSWSKGDHEDSLYHANLASLRRRLVPLPETLAPTIPEESKILEVDTLRSDFGGAWPRFRVQLTDLQCLDGGVLEVTTMRDPSVRVLRQWTITGRRERLAVVSFRGFDFEMGYEVQVPVLLPGERETLRVEQPARDP